MYSWTEKDDLIKIIIPLKKSSPSKVDIFVTSTTLKVNFSPYIVDIILRFPVDPVKHKATVKDGNLRVILYKTDESAGFWGNLEVDTGDKSAIANLREKSIAAQDALEKGLGETRRSRRTEDERFSLKKQMNLDETERNRLDNLKSEEKRSAEQEVYATFSLMQTEKQIISQKTVSSNALQVGLDSVEATEPVDFDTYLRIKKEMKSSLMIADSKDIFDIPNIPVIDTEEQFEDDDFDNSNATSAFSSSTIIASGRSTHVHIIVDEVEDFRYIPPPRVISNLADGKGNMHHRLVSAEIFITSICTESLYSTSLHYVYRNSRCPLYAQSISNPHERVEDCRGGRLDSEEPSPPQKTWCTRQQCRQRFASYSSDSCECDISMFMCLESLKVNIFSAFPVFLLPGNNADSCEENPTWLKEKGDNFYRGGDMRSAVNAYSAALDMDEKMVTCYSNRSACYLRLDMSAECRLDCTEGIKLIDEELANISESNKSAVTLSHAAVKEITTLKVMLSKMLLRRGSANCQMGLFSEALCDYTRTNNILFGYENKNNSGVNKIVNYEDREFCVTGITKPSLAADVGKICQLLDADILKKEGDALFADNKLAESCLKYDEAICLVPVHVGCLSNRSACRLAMKDVHGCIDDCSRALALLSSSSSKDVSTETSSICASTMLKAILPSVGSEKRMSWVVKTLLRRGAAYAQLSQLDEAVEDYRTASALDQKNESLKSDLNKIINFREGKRGTSC